jgi:glycosyltransferase involved in cell wall biosynthesis
LKILFVSLFLPMEKSYHAGGRYVFELLRNLSRSHEIHLATRLEENEFPSLDPLKPFCKKVYPYSYRTAERRGLLDVLSLIINYAGFSRFADRLAGKGDYDLIQVEWVEAAMMMKKRNTPMLLDAHDVITKPAERSMKKSGLSGLLLSLRYRLTRALELHTVRKFDRVFTLSDYDRKYLLRMEPGLAVSTVPIPAGMDIKDGVFERQRNTILFLASYKYRRVNVEAALYFYRSVFPLIKQRIPDAKFIIAGYGPPPELIRLRETDDSVVVPGFVEDLERCHKEAEVFVAPILVGGGIIVKILDAMAAGTPVVTTAYGNEGIGAVPGRDLLVADDPKTFAESVIRLLEDPQSAGEMGRTGREFVRKNFSLENVIGKIESTYGELVNSEK